MDELWRLIEHISTVHVTTQSLRIRFSSSLSHTNDLPLRRKQIGKLTNGGPFGENRRRTKINNKNSLHYFHCIANLPTFTLAHFFQVNLHLFRIELTIIHVSSVSIIFFVSIITSVVVCSHIVLFLILISFFMFSWLR